MTGSATLTTVLSRNAMLDPRIATTSAQRGSWAAGGAGPRVAGSFVHRGSRIVDPRGLVPSAGRT